MKTKTSDFDQQFDDGEGIIEYLDLSKARSPAQEQKRIAMYFPAWMLTALDREAKRLGVTRQSIIKVWLAERLEGRSEGRSEARSEAGRTNPNL